MKLKYIEKILDNYYKKKSCKIAKKISVILDGQIALSKQISDSVCDIIEKNCNNKYKAAFYESMICGYMTKLSKNYYDLTDKSFKLIKRSRLPQIYKITLISVFREGFGDALDITELTKRLLVISCNIINSKNTSPVFKVTIEKNNFADDSGDEYVSDFDPNMDSEDFFEEYYKQFEDGEE
jgi:hypothetical protein